MFHCVTSRFGARLIDGLAALRRFDTKRSLAPNNGKYALGVDADSALENFLSASFWTSAAQKVPPQQIPPNGA